ncbi:MAG: DNA-directed RNA polymerase subunit K [Promethearchaeota archaeon]
MLGDQKKSTKTQKKIKKTKKAPKKSTESTSKKRKTPKRAKRSIKSKEEMEIEIGPPTLTRYEKSRIIGARAIQIAMGAPIILNITEGKMDPIKVAEEELNAGVLPLMILRRLPSGESQSIPLKMLIKSVKH